MKLSCASLLVLALPACASAPKSAPPAAPESAATASPASTPAQAEPPSAPAPVAPMEAPKDDAARNAPGADRAQAESGASSRSELDRAQLQLDAAGSNCMNACRALGSMDRAAGRLCGLARSNDEQDRCTDATKRLKTARDKVKRACGTCPDVTVERNAAIPSR